MKLHYFDQTEADKDDHKLNKAKEDGLIPKNCLLNGNIVSSELARGIDPCGGCQCERSKCGGRPKTIGDVKLK